MFISGIKNISEHTYITRATKISCPYFWVGLELINTAAAFNIASLLHTQKSPNVDEEIAKVVHEGDFACSVDGHAEGGRGQVVEGLQEALSIAGLALMLQQLVHKVTVLILTKEKNYKILHSTLNSNQFLSYYIISCLLPLLYMYVPVMRLK